MITDFELSALITAKREGISIEDDRTTSCLKNRRRMRPRFRSGLDYSLKNNLPRGDLIFGENIAVVWSGIGPGVQDHAFNGNVGKMHNASQRCTSPAATNSNRAT